MLTHYHSIGQVSKDHWYCTAVFCWRWSLVQLFFTRGCQRPELCPSRLGLVACLQKPILIFYLLSRVRGLEHETSWNTNQSHFEPDFQIQLPLESMLGYPYLVSYPNKSYVMGLDLAHGRNPWLGLNSGPQHDWPRDPRPYGTPDSTSSEATKTLEDIFPEGIESTPFEATKILRNIFSKETESTSPEATKTL